MNIIDMNFEPLTESELKKLKENYTQDFDTMNESTALILLKMFLPAMKSTKFDSELSILLIRRLNMILDFKNHPERLV